MPERAAPGRRKPEVALIALGNRWRGDDAAGLELAQRLAQRLTGRCVRSEPKDAAALADALGEARLAVVLDAALSGAPPGTLHRVRPDAGLLRSGAARHSSHALDLAGAIALSRALGRAPERLLVYALEGSRFEPGEGLSEAVEHALAQAVEQIARELVSALGEEPCTSPR